MKHCTHCTACNYWVNLQNANVFLTLICTEIRQVFVQGESKWMDPLTQKWNFPAISALICPPNLACLGFWETWKKKLVALSQKLWIFLWCLTFASYYLSQKTELWLAKVRHKKKIHNFWDKVTKFFFASWQYLKTQAHQIWWSN